MFHGVTGCYSGGFRNRGPGGRPPLIFSPDLDQRGGKICFLGTAPPPQLYLKVWIRQRVIWCYKGLHGITRS